MKECVHVKTWNYTGAILIWAEMSTEDAFQKGKLWWGRSGRRENKEREGKRARRRTARDSTYRNLLNQGGYRHCVVSSCTKRDHELKGQGANLRARNGGVLEQWRPARKNRKCQ